MSVFSTGMNHRSFLWQITSLCFVLGLLISAAWQTATQIKRAGVAPNRAGFVYGSDVQVAAKKAAEYEKEINKLNSENARLIKGKDAESEKNKKLNEYRIFAGLTQVTGAGIQVTLVDSSRRNAIANDPLSLASLIHDQDIVQVVNELKAAGAEAIAINGERVIGISSIRCVGPVVHVNNVPSAPPYVIQVIGDPNALYGGIILPNGVLDKLRQFDPNMARVEKKSNLLLPAFAGGTQMRFAKEAKSSEETAADAQQAKEQSKEQSKEQLKEESKDKTETSQDEKPEKVKTDQQADPKSGSAQKKAADRKEGTK